MYRAAIGVGVLLVATAGLLAMADSDELSRKLPLQVPPRSTLRPLLATAAVLLVVGVVGLTVG